MLLQAEGKSYIKTSLTMFTNVFKNVMKIILMTFGFDVVFVQAIAMAVSLIQMIYILWYIRKHYQWIDLKVTPNTKAISQSKNVLVHQVSGLIFNNTDNIVLSIFCGLKTVSVYAMYNLFYTMINTAQVTVSGSVVFLLGQTFHSDKKRFIKLYDCYEVYYLALTFALYSVTTFFILPFMKLYTKGVNDIDYINQYLPYLFAVIGLLSSGRNAPNNVIGFAEHFKQTQYRSIIEAIINISVSIISVMYFGIYGVLFGTIAALLYRTNDIIIYANKKILQRSVWIAYKRWIANIVVFVIVQFLSRFIILDLSSYWKVFLWAVPYTAATFIIYFGVASLLDIETAKFAIQLAIEKIKGRKA